ncbi:hypothetical protein PR048_000206 [Dryococelus australis]|uniref:Uncharacterized protein n=1 Tax=Dryococelus australis TaxID=614101 RepID=A0ABQ9IE24_9NEOP|nr:hypothetical protein PR048_000206 [Dryococelus australis]
MRAHSPMVRGDRPLTAHAPRRGCDRRARRVFGGGRGKDFRPLAGTRDWKATLPQDTPSRALSQLLLHPTDNQVRVHVVSCCPLPRVVATLKQISTRRRCCVSSFPSTSRVPPSVSDRRTLTALKQPLDSLGEVASAWRSCAAVVLSKAVSQLESMYTLSLSALKQPLDSLGEVASAWRSCAAVVLSKAVSQLESVHTLSQRSRSGSCPLQGVGNFPTRTFKSSKKCAVFYEIVWFGNNMAAREGARVSIECTSSFTLPLALSSRSWDSREDSLGYQGTAYKLTYDLTYSLPGIRTQSLPHPSPAAHRPTAPREVGFESTTTRLPPWRTELSYAVIEPDNAAGQRVFSGISHFPRPFIPVLIYPHLASPSTALKTSMLRAAQLSSLTLRYLECQQWQNYRPVKKRWYRLFTANRVQSPAGSPDFRKWESARTMPLVGGSSRGSLLSPAPSFRCRSIFISITLIGSQDLAVKSHPNFFTHALTRFDQKIYFYAPAFPGVLPLTADRRHIFPSVPLVSKQPHWFFSPSFSPAYDTPINTAGKSSVTFSRRPGLNSRAISRGVIISGTINTNTFVGRTQATRFCRLLAKRRWNLGGLESPANVVRLHLGKGDSCTTVVRYVGGSACRFVCPPTSYLWLVLYKSGKIATALLNDVPIKPEWAIIVAEIHSKCINAPGSSSAEFREFVSDGSEVVTTTEAKEKSHRSVCEGCCGVLHATGSSGMQELWEMGDLAGHDPDVGKPVCVARHVIESASPLRESANFTANSVFTSIPCRGHFSYSELFHKESRFVANLSSIKPYRHSLSAV